MSKNKSPVRVIFEVFNNALKEVRFSFLIKTAAHFFDEFLYVIAN